ncbi:MAG TPA: RidA family protein [Acidimicrobiia bacterium]|nr:RidA family protein [Acidimicrobiia bacterium]
MREAINPPTLPTPPGYSQVIRVSGGTTIYIAGQVAWDSENNLVGRNDFETQTRQVLTNLVAALDAVDAGVEHLVKICVYVVDHDANKLDVIRRVRDEFFGDITPPTSTLLGVSTLALPDLMIEIDAVAYVDGGPTR